MTPEQIASMTLADLEAVAERFSKAVATIREAQALLGGHAQVAPVDAPRAPAPAAPAAPASADDQALVQEIERSNALKKRLMGQFPGGARAE